MDEMEASDPAYAIGVEWSQALDKVLSGELDPVDMDAMFRAKVEEASEAGSSSPILAAIEQQLPKITAPGHIAAFKQEIDDVLGSTYESFCESMNEDEGMQPVPTTGVEVGSVISVEGKPGKVTGLAGSGDDEVADVEFEDGTGTTIPVTALLAMQKELPAGSKGNTALNGETAATDVPKDATTNDSPKVDDKDKEDKKSESVNESVTPGGVWDVINHRNGGLRRD